MSNSSGQPDGFGTKAEGDWLKVGLISSVLVVALISIGLYLLEFYENGFAQSTSEWADFATYLSGTVGVASVVATLIVLVRTLGQQQQLIESQNRMLEQQEKQIRHGEQLLEAEREKSSDDALRRRAESDYAAMFLKHHFETIKNFLERAPDAFRSNNGKYFIEVYKKHPGLYSALLLGNDEKLIDLIIKMDEDLARKCVGAVVNAKYVFEFIEYHVSSVGPEQRLNHNVGNYMRRLKASMPDRFDAVLESAEAGLRDCSDFIEKADSFIGS